MIRRLKLNARDEQKSVKKEIVTVSYQGTTHQLSPSVTRDGKNTLISVGLGMKPVVVSILYNNTKNVSGKLHKAVTSGHKKYRFLNVGFANGSEAVNNPYKDVNKFLREFCK